ncbi:Pol polyprotein [Elysia marginata]|uniref:Pol polyprotein n=1 Tax=Elysia marginata TaxID=1093978 RepID=A0AAV4J662_9GAST|nr:Pol polyprotein [Elysia marginata]
MATYGSRVVHLHFGTRVFDVRLISANVKRPLLGADFLHQHNLLVVIRGRRLIEADSFSHISCSVSSISTDSVLALIGPTSNRFRKILNGYPELLQPTFPTAEVKHGVKHFIPTKKRPVFARARRLAPDKLASAKKEFLEMETMDDILVASSSAQSHIDNLNAVFHRLRHYGLVIKLEKCLFGKSSFDFLGHQVSAAGLVPMPSRVSAVKNFSQRRDVKALQEYLGILNFYHRFIPNLASTLRPLYQVINTSKPRQSLNWTKEINNPSLLCKPTSLGRGNYAGQSLHGLSNNSDVRCI